MPRAMIAARPGAIGASSLQRTHMAACWAACRREKTGRAGRSSSLRCEFRASQTERLPRPLARAHVAVAQVRRLARALFVLAAQACQSIGRVGGERRVLGRLEP